MTQIPTLKDVQMEKCRRSYEYYVKYVHEPQYIESKFTKFITNEIQTFIETPTNRAYEILCLSVPPQHGKSMNITETLPSWLIGKFPQSRIIIASYNDTFAWKLLRRNSAKIEEFGQHIFDIKLTKDSQDTIELKNGSIIARGLGSGITGEPGKYVVIDDPIKNREEARSITSREKLWSGWLSNIKSRLAPGAKIIVIQTRWHKEDLIGIMMQNEPNARYINLPVECIKDRDEMGRVYGEMLCPEIGRDREWWESFKLSYMNEEGSEAVNSLYYGNPTSTEGNILKREWFKFYVDLPRLMHITISVDATFKSSANSDFVAIQVWGKSNNSYYLLHRVKERLSFTETVKRIQGVIHQYPNYDEIIIEDKANGSAIIDTLNKKYNCVLPIVPKESKEARASAIAPLLEAGQVYVRSRDYPLIDESVDFPNSDHDDEVDCMSQSLNRMRNVNAEIPKPSDPDEIDYDDEIESILSYG